MRNVFENLFVLEMANNHWGSLDRGLKIIRDFSKVVRFNSIKAAIKLQFRDVENFIHKDFKGNQDIRYITKTEATAMTEKEYSVLINEIVKNGCIPMATPFDEVSVDLCVKLGIKIIKIASSDLNDWPLIEKIASTKLPIIVSTGGSEVKDIDDLITFFENRNIDIAINHCVSLYPSEDDELELNQIDYLKNRYPNHIIGFSTHEYHDWNNSIMMAYAKGAKTFERHIDINYKDVPVSKYCSLPNQIDTWFKAFKKAKTMCGGSKTEKRNPPKREIKYLDALVRGAYAKRSIPKGYILSNVNISKDFYFAVPLLQGQMSCREIMNGENISKEIAKDEPLLIDNIDAPYSNDPQLKELIYKRGVKIPKKD